MLNSAHRIGQKREVRVLRLITSNSVEELVLARAQRKLEIDGKIIQAGKFDDSTSGEDYEALLVRVQLESRGRADTDVSQAKAFEQNDEEEEDTKEIDDDELNALLARGDNEEEIFAQMDRDREADKLADWRAKGNKGPVPPPLMAESELPPFYRRDIGNELAASDLQNEDEQGRGRRTKTEVKYTDGLTDEQWLNAVDASDDDIDDAVERKRARIDKKSERKRMNEMLEKAEAEGKPLNLSAVKMEVDAAGTGAGTGAGAGGLAVAPKKRGRPSNSATPSVLGDDGAAVSTDRSGLDRADESDRNDAKWKERVMRNKHSC
jgi:ATP-dependent helicase STH1/SNF2